MKFPFGTEPVFLRQIRGACVSLVQGTAHMKLASDGYQLVFNRDVKLERLEMPKEALGEFLRFHGKGFCNETIELAVSPSAELIRSITEWDPEMNAWVSGGKLKLCWRRKFTLVGLYDTPKWKFVLTKENLDLPNLVNAAEKRLGLPRSAIAFAGIKDKRAITSQFLTCPSVVSPEKIAAAFTVDGVSVSDFTLVDRPLKPGVHWGNHFELQVVGNRPLTTAQCTEIQTKLSNEGFVNFFGTQRFGFPNPDGSSKHMQVGAAMMKRDWETACRLLLQPDQYMAHFIDQTRLDEFSRALETGDFKTALELAKSFGSASQDRITLLGPLAGGASFDQAIRKIPKTLLHLYPASLISFLWNCKASQLVKAAGGPQGAGEVTLPHFGFLKHYEDRQANLRLYSDVIETEGLSFLLDTDLDFTKDFGFNCKMTTVPRPLIAKPLAFSLHQDLKTLNFKFALPSGSYATVLLEDVL